MSNELAKRQICRILGEYPDGMSRGQLYARIECSISYREFTAALRALEQDAVLETGADERVRIKEKSRAAAVAA